MNTLGIIGGIGPESTIDYYRLFISQYRTIRNDGSYPSLFINSIDMKKMLDLISHSKFDEVAGFITDEIIKLKKAGADFGIIASNTPHIVFDKIREQSSLPLISIVEAACEYAKNLEVVKAGLLGTKFTIKGEFYQKVFNDNGIEIIIPESNEIELLHYKYMNELVKGNFLPETKKQFLNIIDGLINEHNIDCLILGGTELPLLLRDKYYRGIPLLNTAKIHVDAAIKELFL